MTCCLKWGPTKMRNQEQINQTAIMSHNRFVLQGEMGTRNWALLHILSPPLKRNIATQNCSHFQQTFSTGRLFIQSKRCRAKPISQQNQCNPNMKAKIQFSTQAIQFGKGKYVFSCTFWPAHMAGVRPPTWPRFTFSIQSVMGRIFEMTEPETDHSWHV